MVLKKKFKNFYRLVFNKLTISQLKLLLLLKFNKKIKHFIFLRLSYKHIERNEFATAISYWKEAFFLNMDEEYSFNHAIKIYSIFIKNNVSDKLVDEFRKYKNKETYFYFSALTEMAKRNNLKAISLFKKLINKKEKKSYRNSLLKLLLLLEREKETTEFWKFFHYYEELHPHTKAKYYIQSIYYHNRLEWEECIKVVKPLLETKKYKDRAFRLFIVSNIHMGQFNDVYSYLINNNYKIDDHTIQELLGIYYYYQFNYKEAINFFLQAIDSHPYINKAAIRWLAKAYKNDQKPDEAIKLFDKYKNYHEEEIFTLNLAKSAGLLQYIEKKLEQYLNQNMYDPEITEWFVKYLLDHRYWGRAYKFIMDMFLRDHSFDYLVQTQKNLEDNFTKVSINIKEDFKSNKDIEQYKSSELIVDEILNKTKQISLQREIPNKIKRIALVLTSLGPGGAERQCVNLLNGLIEKIDKGEIDDVRLFVTSLSRTSRESFYLDQVLDKSKVIEFYNRKKLIKIEEVPRLGEFSNVIPLMQPITRQQALLYLTKHLDDFNPDVIHGFQNEAILNSFLVGSILQTPSLFGRWGSMPPDISRNLSLMQKRNVDYMNWAYKSIEKKIKNKIFSTNSMMAARAYEQWIDAEKLSVKTIYNGLNLDRLSISRDAMEIKHELNIDKDEYVVGSVYRVSDEKRPFLWVDVAEEVNKRSKHKVHFVLVGDGPLLSELMEYIKEKQANTYIHLLGRHDDVANWYNIMDVFILTSAVEGIANAMLEAQYLGVPVVVPNVGGLKEAVLEEITGHVLNDDSKENFAKSIMYFLDKEWTNVDREVSKKYIKDKFSIVNMINNTLECYHENLKQ